MTTPKLTSVIMVTYHTGPVLDRAIASVLAQTADIELVLINNGNPPDVESRLIERFKDEPLVRVMTGHGNIGSAKGRNLGARVARGDHFLFLAPEAVLEPDAVAKLHKAALELKRPFMMGARLVDEKGRDIDEARQNILTPISAVVETLGLWGVAPKMRNFAKTPIPKKVDPVPAICGHFLYVPRADFVALRGFDEGYFLGPVAMDFCTKFARLGGQAYFVPDVKVVLDRRNPRTKTASYEKQRVKDLTRYFHENFSHSYPQPLLWALYLGIGAWGWLRARNAKTR